MPSFAPVSVLDFGCGPGTAALAIMDVFQQNSMGKYTGEELYQLMRHELHPVVATDPSIHHLAFVSLLSKGWICRQVCWMRLRSA